MKIRYGKEIMTKTLDPNGSSLVTTTVFKDFKEFITNRYEIRIPVKDEKEELQQYLLFQKEKQGKIKPEFRVEHSKTGDEQGYYYIVKAWTEP